MADISRSDRKPVVGDKHAFLMRIRKVAEDINTSPDMDMFDPRGNDVMTMESFPIPMEHR